MVSKPTSEMETCQGQLVVRKRVRKRWSKEQCQRERDAWPIEVSKRRRRRRGGKNRCAHTSARQSVRGAEPTPTAGEMCFGFCASPARK